VTDEQPAAKQGLNWKKILLGCGCAAFLSAVLCAGGVYWWISSAFTMDPPKVMAKATEILPGATLPEGYNGAFAVDMMGFKMAMLSPVTFQQGQELSGMACILMTLPTGGNAAQAKSQMQMQMSQQTGQQGSKVEKLDPETVKVAGQDVQLTKQRTTSQNGQGKPMLQMMVILPRGQSTSMIMFMGPEEGFDRAALDAFLASIPAETK
jgi:hypothetical protein